jgi:hypothetical protein
VSNSVVFLLIAVGLSVIGATAVWLHGRPRRNRRHTDDFGATLRALSQTQIQRDAESARGTRPADPKAPSMSPRDPRRSRESGPGA